MNRQSDQGSSSQPVDWLIDTARRNPEALLLMAAGCALLMRTGSKAARSSAHGGGHRVNDGQWSSGVARQAAGAFEQASGAFDSAKQYADDMSDRVASTAKSYADGVSEFAGDARRKLSEGSDQLVEHAQSAWKSTQSTVQDTMERVLREQPLAVALVGLAAGASVAAAFPASDIEKRTLGPTGAALTDAATEAGKKVVEAAGKAGERLKEAAEERGLSRDGLKDLAGEAAEAFKSSVSKGSNEHSEATTVPHMPAEKPAAGADVTGRSSR